MNKKVFLNDLGIINVLGSGKDKVFNGLVSGERGCFSKINIESIDYSVGMYKDYNPEISNRINQLLDKVCNEIKPTVDQCLHEFGAGRIGVVLGSTDNGSEQSLQALKEYKESGLYPTGYSLEDQQAHKPSDFVKDFFGTKNIATTISTACTSSGSAIILAYKLILADVVDAVIVGGVDIVSSSVLKGFISLDAVDPKGTIPFSKNRKGINLGEGAALFVMSKNDFNNNNIELAGYGECSDAYHSTAPDPKGLGAMDAMTKALSMFGQNSVDYVNLHGTGTILNDNMESLATGHIFNPMPKVSSTKPMTGHTLGAASAVELGFCWLLLSSRNVNNLLPRHIWDKEFQEDLPIMNFVNLGDSAPGLNSCMSNSYAFGGCNVSIIIKKGGI